MNSKIEQNYKSGDIVELSENALDNENYIGFIGEDEKLIVTQVYTSTSEHPGFDTFLGMALYSLKRKGTHEELPFDLYDWELIPG